MKMSQHKTRPYFEKNLGQLPSDITYKVKANDYITYFTKEEVIVSLPSNIEKIRNIFSMKLENTNDNVEIKGQEKQIGIVNYLMGNDESKWIKNIPTYSKIKYKSIYENIDLYYYINDYNLEYDFVLAKGANPKDISISFEGTNHIEINENQNISLSVGDVKVLLLKPVVYQIIDGIKVNIDCEYMIDENNKVNFLINEYEEEYELVLDPVLKLDYSTYLGGIEGDYATGIDIDDKGCMYITGYTDGNFPPTMYAMQTHSGGGSDDAFIAKIDPREDWIIYATYVGGSGADYAKGISVDSEGCAYITGRTSSPNYPITSGAYQTSYKGTQDAFVSKLNSDGTGLIYSTYIGGSSYDSANALYLDDEGCVYITGFTNGKYPTTTGAYQTSFVGKTNVFVSKLTSDGSALIYSTLIGGSGYNSGNGIVVDGEGCAYVTGYAGDKYPVTKGAFQSSFGGIQDAFITKLNSTGSALIYSTYMGGEGDDCGNGIAVDSEGYAYIVGYTESDDYPLANAYQNRYGGSRDIIVSKVNTKGSELVYSTFIGDGGIENGYVITLDNEGYAYIGGTVSGCPAIGKLSIDGIKLIYLNKIRNTDNDCVRGLKLDNEGWIYISGYAESGYPTTEDSWQPACKGMHDSFITKLTSIEFNTECSYTPSKVKLLDTFTTKLNIQNISIINLDFNIKYQPLDSGVAFVPNSLLIQNVNLTGNTIPSEIYLSNIDPQKTIEITCALRNIRDTFPKDIPVTVVVEVYDSESGAGVLLDSKTETIYIKTTTGPIYIPGCNQELYNLKIEGSLQIDASGTPIIYYKTGTSYIYIESNVDTYEYKVLENPINVTEYKIS